VDAVQQSDREKISRGLTRPPLQRRPTDAGETSAILPDRTGQTVIPRGDNKIPYGKLSNVFHKISDRYFIRCHTAYRSATQRATSSTARNSRTVKIPVNCSGSCRRQSLWPPISKPFPWPNPPGYPGAVNQYAPITKGRTRSGGQAPCDPARSALGPLHPKLFLCAAPRIKIAYKETTQNRLRSTTQKRDSFGQKKRPKGPFFVNDNKFSIWRQTRP